MISERQLARSVQSAMSRAAEQTSAFLGGVVGDEVSTGRWEVDLEGGETVILDRKNLCQTPLKGQKWDVSRKGNRLQLDGPSGYG